MPKYIQTKIRRLESGAVEVESQLVVSTVETIPAGASDMPSVIDTTKQKTREAIFNRLYQQVRNDAVRAYAEIAAVTDSTFARMKLEMAFAPLVNAGKWLEEDAEDAGEEKIAGEDLRAGDAVYRGEDGKYRKLK